MLRDYLEGRKVGWPALLLKRAALVVSGILFSVFCAAAQTCVLAQEEPDVMGIPGYKGMSMPGNWRPFNNYSYWNTVIPAGIGDHSQSYYIINDMAEKGITLRFNGTWTTTMHVVGSKASKYQYHSSTNIYRFTHFKPDSCWNPDPDNDDISNRAYPFIPGVTYPENMHDGRMIIIDKSATNKYTAYEVTHGSADLDSHGHAICSNFNIWHLGYRGFVYYRPPCGSTGVPLVNGDECTPCDDYWTCAGSSGAGTPLIGGLLRPEELDNAMAAPLAPDDPNYNPEVATGDGLIHHALSFCYYFNRCGPPLYPVAYRGDGSEPMTDLSKPVEGMLFQLVDPNNWLLNHMSNDWGKIVVRTLKTYGMYLVDGGSNPTSAALYLQNMYTPNVETNVSWWNRKYPGFLASITGIRIKKDDGAPDAPYYFRVVNTESPSFHDYEARPLPEHAECP